MSIEADLQIESAEPGIPAGPLIAGWVNYCLEILEIENASLTIRIVDKAEISALNSRFRKKNKPTNVLSFCFDPPAGLTSDLLGDIVICAPVVTREAKDFGIEVESRWCHMVTHGLLHLCGYDHVEADGTAEMESLETRLLEALGYGHPYESIAGEGGSR